MKKSRKVGPPVIAIAISPVIAIANAKNCKDGTSSGCRNDGCTGCNEAKDCLRFPLVLVLVLILVIPDSGLTCKDGVVSLVNLPTAGDIGQSMGLPHHGSLRVPNS